MNKKTASVTQELQRAIAQAKARGYTGAEIAKRAGMTRGQLHRIAEGERIPRLDTAERIAAAVGMSLILSVKPAGETK